MKKRIVSEENILFGKEDAGSRYAANNTHGSTVSNLDVNESEDGIERDFWAAFKRIVGNNPKNPKNLAKAKLNKLSCNNSTVALEAGHSRTLIALENCKYPLIRAAINDVQRPRVKGKTQKERNHELIVEKRDLGLARKVALSRVSACVLRMAAMEKEFTKRMNQKKRETKNAGVDLKIVGRELDPKCEKCGRPL